MTIAQRLGAAFGLMFLLLALTSALAIFNVDRLAQTSAQLYDHPMAVTSAVLSADGNIVRVHRGMKDVALATSEADLEKALAAVNQFEARTYEEIALARERFLGPKDRFDQLVRLMDEWRAIRARTIAFKKEGKVQEAAAITKGEGAAKVAELAAAMKEIKESAAKEAAAFNADAKDLHRHTTWVTFGVGAAGALAAALLGSLITIGITRPLRAAVAVAGEVANGSLTHRIEASGRDEVSQLLTSLARMQEKLREVVLQIASNSQRLSSAATQLSENAERVSQGTATESASASSISAAMEQMNVSIAHVSENAATAQRIAAESGDLSTRGGVVIHRTVSEIEAIAQGVSGSAQLIGQLDRHATEISGIADVIKRIADQTNLLALNAAIEAARAGEQGRGFAVVADEVRNLAENTSRSTQEIANMIAKIQEGTRSAVSSMDGSVGLVNRGAALAGEAGESITQINGRAAEVVQVVEEISLALREQTAASEDIARSINKIAEMIEHNGSAVKETAGAANEIRNLATELDGMVRWFRI